MRKTITVESLLTVIFAVLVTSVSLQAAAKTPDGSTPAVETVCDEFKDSVPGLYGLCVAYCEAQDLDDFDKDSSSPDALERNIIRKSGDPLSCGGGRD